MNTDPDEARNAVQSAVAALRRGDKVEAQRLALLATRLAPDSETPWLILAALAGPAESLGYIQKALQINPNSKPALQAKKWALEKLLAQAPAPPAFQPAEEPVPPAFQPPEESVPPAFQPPEESIPPAFRPEEPPETESFQSHEAFFTGTEAPPEQPEDAAELIPAESALESGSSFEASPASFSNLRSPEPVYQATQSEEEIKQGKIPSFSQARTFWLVLLGLLIVSIIAGIIIIQPLLSGQFGNSPGGNKCIASLMIGPKSYEVRTVVANSEGRFYPPTNRPKNIYWVAGTDTNLVFALGSSVDNLVLAPLVTPGNLITLVWPNCNTARFQIKELKPDQPFKLGQVDLTLAQISIFIPSATATKGYLVIGELLEETINSLGTPDSAQPLVEVSVLVSFANPDQTTLAVGVVIQNFGQTAVTLTSNDVSLTPEDGTPVALTQTEPILPVTIQPGTSATIYLTFKMPSSPTAILQVYTTENTLQGY